MRNATAPGRSSPGVRCDRTTRLSGAQSPPSRAGRRVTRSRRGSRPPDASLLPRKRRRGGFATLMATRGCPCPGPRSLSVPTVRAPKLQRLSLGVPSGPFLLVFRLIRGVLRLERPVAAAPVFDPHSSGSHGAARAVAGPAPSGSVLSRLSSGVASDALVADVVYRTDRERRKQVPAEQRA